MHSFCGSAFMQISCDSANFHAPPSFTSTPTTPHLLATTVSTSILTPMQRVSLSTELRSSSQTEKPPTLSLLHFPTTQRKEFSFLPCRRERCQIMQTFHTSGYILPRWIQVRNEKQSRKLPFLASLAPLQTQRILDSVRMCLFRATCAKGLQPTQGQCKTQSRSASKSHFSAKIVGKRKIQDSAKGLCSDTSTLSSKHGKRSTANTEQTCHRLSSGSQRAQIFSGGKKKVLIGDSGHNVSLCVNIER